MAELNPTTEKASDWKALGGGIAALGIFASLLVLGNFDFQKTEILQAEILATDAPIAAITFLDPIVGKAGDWIQLTVENLENFDETTSAVFFEANTAEIITVEIGEENETVLVVQVPPLKTAGAYAVKIVTPTGLIESPTKFEFLPNAKIEPTTNPVGMTVDEVPLIEESEIAELELFDSWENFEETPDELNFLEAEPTATLFENDSDFEKSAPTSSPISAIPPPRDLKAVSTPAGIQLTWQGETKNYHIYYGSQSGNYLHRISSENFAEIISQNLEYGKIYFLMVKAVDAFGNESPASAEISAIFTAESVENSTNNFHPAAPHPPQLSEQGPAASLGIALLMTLAVTLFGFRKKSGRENNRFLR